MKLLRSELRHWQAIPNRLCRRRQSSRLLLSSKPFVPLTSLAPRFYPGGLKCHLSSGRNPKVISEFAQVRYAVLQQPPPQFPVSGN